MHPRTKTMPLMLLLALPSGAFSQVESVVKEYPSEVEYRGSPDLPDGVAFHSTLRLLKDIDEPDCANISINWIRQELRLKEADARAFWNKAMMILQNIDADLEAAQTAALCEAGVSKAYNGDVYPLLQQTYDIREHIAEQYFLETKATLNSETADRLEHWMDKHKLSMGYVRIDFEKADEQTGRDTTAYVADFCKT